MTKKKTKGSGTDSGGGGNDTTSSDRKRHEQPLQAVVLAADWYHDPPSTSAVFQPLILDRPKVLCPIVNQTMIDYTINYLSNQGVQELYIVCVSYDVEVYINQTIERREQEHQQHQQQSQQYQPSSSSLITMKIMVIRDTTITNDGDALREMEKRNVIQSDPFILMYGDTITNVSLAERIKQYQYRRSLDNNTICMMILKSIGASSTLHSTMDNVVIGFNNITPSPLQQSPSNAVSNHHHHLLLHHSGNASNSGISDCSRRIILYDNHHRSGSVTRKSTIQLPCSFMNSICTEVMIRTDLYDTGIDLCSPDLLVRFSDEFDYQHIRNQFITNTVAEEETGLQQSIYGCIVTESEYCARIHDLRIYHQISNDILRRYVYPIVPDNVAVNATSSNHQQPLLRYTVQHHFMYYQYESLLLSSTNTNTSSTIIRSASRIGRSSIVTGPGLIGHSCHVDEHCCIRSSVIGNSCSISERCTICESHIWENTIIESNVTIHQSIIGSHVVIKSGVSIPRGCIIGSGCVIGTNMKLLEYTRITCSKAVTNDDFNNNGDDNDWGGDGDDPEDVDMVHNEEVAIQNKLSADDDEAFVSDVEIVGTDGKGRVWQPLLVTDIDDDDEEDDDHDPLADVIERTTANDITIKSQCIGYDARNFYSDRLLHRDDEDDDDSFSADDNDIGNRPDMYDDEDDEYDDDDNVDNITFGELSSTPAATTGITNTTTLIFGRQDGVDVVKELKLICLEYEGGSIDNLGIELNSYKFSQNATYADCTMAAIMAIVEKMNVTSKMSDGKLISEFKSSIELWSSLLHKMCISVDEEMSIILGLERSAIGDNNDGDAVTDEITKNEQVTKLSSGMSFRLLLQTLHDEEIVNEEAILAWANERRKEIGNTIPLNTTSQQERRLRLFQLQPVQDFLEWLEDGDDDDDDDEEDEDEDE